MPAILITGCSSGFGLETARQAVDLLAAQGSFVPVEGEPDVDLAALLPKGWELWLDGGHNAGAGEALAAQLPNAADYDTVYVGFPIWWYVAPTIVNTFLESIDLSGKTVVPFATSGGSGMGKTNEHLAPSCRGAKLLNGKVFKRGVSKEELAAWAESL